MSTLSTRPWLFLFVLLAISLGMACGSASGPDSDTGDEGTSEGAAPAVTVLPGDEVDVDGDGEPDGIALDTNGDGVVDALDTNGDGEPDGMFTPPASAGDGDGSRPGDDGGDGDADSGVVTQPTLEGFHNIVAHHSGKLLDVSDVSLESGATIHQWQQLNEDNQRWGFEKDGDTYTIVVKHSGMCLSSSGSESGSDVIQESCSESGTQSWEVILVDGGLFSIALAGTNLCIEVIGASTEDAANAQLTTCAAVDHQRFRLLPTENTSKNPLPFGIFTADPSAHVWDDGRLYVYPSHDPNNAGYWEMVDYHVFSTDDMINWTDHGVALRSSDVSWGDAWLYAPDAAYRNGTYYLYFPKTESHIGVATSNSPTGPFVDALGAPLIERNGHPEPVPQRVFDPAVFIDDDGQAYMVYGGGDGGNDARIVRLKDNMIELDGQPQVVQGLPAYFEGPWLHKHNGKYYFSYSDNVGETRIAYSVADHLEGPYTPMGVILDTVLYWTNHHSIVEFKGQWYMFYHVGDGSNYTRRVAVDYLYYNADGSIAKVTQTASGVARVQ